MPKIKNCAKKQVVNLWNASVAHLANPCDAPFEKHCSRGKTMACFKFKRTCASDCRNNR